MSKDIDDLMGDLEKKALEVSLPDNVEWLQKEIVRLRKIIESYGLQDEMHVSNIEFICQKGIDNLKKASMNGFIDEKDAKVLDTLHKNLRIARGQLEKKDIPGKQASEADLLRIVKDDK